MHGIEMITEILYFVGPISGCDAISDQGRCYSYFISSSINWNGGSCMCHAWGGDLATVTTLEEQTLMYNTITAGDHCWLGLSDLTSENTFVWADNTTSTYRYWRSGQPDDAGGNEDCVGVWANRYWNDYPCGTTLTCYFCSTTGQLK